MGKKFIVQLQKLFSDISAKINLKKIQCHLIYSLDVYLCLQKNNSFRERKFFDVELQAYDFMHHDIRTSENSTIWRVIYDRNLPKILKITQ